MKQCCKRCFGIKYHGYLLSHTSIIQRRNRTRMILQITKETQFCHQNLHDVKVAQVEQFSSGSEECQIYVVLLILLLTEYFLILLLTESLLRK